MSIRIEGPPHDGFHPIRWLTCWLPGMVKTNLIRTSAAHLPRDGSTSVDIVNGGHDALNQRGVQPDVAVAWALKTLEDNCFWALPPAVIQSETSWRRSASGPRPRMDDASKNGESPRRHPGSQ
jgi:hypothetical protein